ncbi:SIP domain-containing protein [Paraliomyxa miuraensis]|uniref:hypothetical protein n=1 Tax=Paraliomyxa miuraensis TaxID=376150 RepID=UPI00224C9E0E|nr:hypothetical protein [Paraliomyxa miuraensis]MCX4245527.1 hypothetical protein [Paraliomyxa miuraensis]
MSSVKGRIIRVLSGVLLERAEVASVQEIGGFQRLLLRCDVPGFSAGAKVQLLLPSNDMRTYTPIPAPDGMILLGWKLAGGPGGRWMSNARVGDSLLFLGPQRSLALDTGPVVLVGDETSVAVAAAFAAERPGQIYAVIQARTASDVRAAAASVGLHQVDVVARGATASTVDAVAAKLSASPNALVALTGGSALVVGVRDALRRAGMRKFKAKTYWIPGRTGLD